MCFILGHSSESQLYIDSSLGTCLHKGNWILLKTWRRENNSEQSSRVWCRKCLWLMLHISYSWTGVDEILTLASLSPSSLLIALSLLMSAWHRHSQHYLQSNPINVWYCKKCSEKLGAKTRILKMCSLFRSKILKTKLLVTKKGLKRFPTAESAVSKYAVSKRSYGFTLCILEADFFFIKNIKTLSCSANQFYFLYLYYPVAFFVDIQLIFWTSFSSDIYCLSPVMNFIFQFSPKTTSFTISLTLCPSVPEPLKVFPLTLLPSNMMTTSLCAYSWISVSHAWNSKQTDTYIHSQNMRLHKTETQRGG